jgi:hypothetical protein
MEYQKRVAKWQEVIPSVILYMEAGKFFTAELL